MPILSVPSGQTDLVHSNDEIEPSEPSVAGLLHVEEQCLVKQPVSGISGLFGKIKLGGEDAPTRALDLEMEMTRSAGIKRGHDGVEPPAPLRVGELVSAQAEANAVIVAVFVRMPDLDEASDKRPAAIVEDKPGDRYPFAVEGVFMELAIARRVRPEERTGFPLQSEVVSVATFQGQRKFRAGLRECPGPGGVDQRQCQECDQ